MKQLDRFERSLKESVDNFEVPYDSADWKSLERRMNGGRMMKWTGQGMLAGVLLGGLLVGGATWLLMSGTETPPAPEPTTAGAVATLVVTPNVDPAEPVEVAPPSKAATNEAPVPEEKGRSIVPAPVPSAAAEATQPAPAKAPAKAPSELAAYTSDACPGTPVTFNVETLPLNAIFLWNFGDGGFSNKRAPEHIYTKPGTYQVTLSMSSPGGGSFQNRPISNVITVHDAPRAHQEVSERMVSKGLVEHRFANKSKHSSSYQWNFGDGNTSTAEAPGHIYRNAGRYVVELVATNDAGCEDRSVSEIVIEKDLDLNAPTSFRPDGTAANGFMPEALLDLNTPISLTIFDRNGQPIYETRKANAPWTGNSWKNEACSPGSYVWVADVLLLDGRTETFTGKVELVR